MLKQTVFRTLKNILFIAAGALLKGEDAGQLELF